MTTSVRALERTGARIEARAAALTGHPLFWVALVGLLASWPLVWALRNPAPPPPAVLGVVPPFRLVDEQGRPFGSDDLRGQVWAAGFIFTRCATICPAVTARMHRIQGRMRQMAPSFHLVSFTVDPEFDTPEVLAAYARAHRANPRTWTFLSGPPAEVRRAVTEGLRTAMGREPGPAGAPGEIFHGSHLVLVDGEGRIRGTYDSEQDDAVDGLVRDAALLVNRKR